MSNNPWAGLASYQDPASGSTLLFCGRDNESYDLAALVDDNIFCTLYGKSGTGKTSLLNAGMFPRLRAMGYLPLSIRLGMEALGSTFQQCIAARLGKAATLQTADTVPLPDDDQDEQWLWAWFARTRFVDSEGKVRFPVLVFDQFEEVFRSRRTEAETLLRQVHFMMDPSHSLGDDYDYNFRFLASIREDDLYLLEDSLDRHFMGDMKQCRYRLNALSDEGARDVILKPGEGLFAAGELDAIVDTVIGIARSADGSINTNILSLVCSRIYDHYRRSGDSHISLDLVKRFVSSNPFEQFYNEVTESLGEKEKQFIEDRLVDAAGRRGSVSEPDFEKNVPNGAHLLEGTGRILQRVASGTEGRSYRIELIHDSFCAPLADQKLKRAARRRRRITIAVSILALIVATVAAYIIVMSIRNARQTREILIQQEKFYAKQASQLLDEGDTYTALLLLNELTDPDGPFAKIPLQPEAECQMRRAVQMHDEAEWQVEWSIRNVGKIAYTPQMTPDGRYMVVSVVGGIKIFNCSNRELEGMIDMGETTYPIYAISHDGEKIVLNSGTIPDSLKFYNLPSGKLNHCIRLSDNRMVEEGDNFTFSQDDSHIIFSSNNVEQDGVNEYIMRLDNLTGVDVDSSKHYVTYGTAPSLSVEVPKKHGGIVTSTEFSKRAIVVTNEQSGEIIDRIDISDCPIQKPDRYALSIFFRSLVASNYVCINDKELLIQKNDGIYIYKIREKKWRQLVAGTFDMKLCADKKFGISENLFMATNKDSVFLYHLKDGSVFSIFRMDTTCFDYACLNYENNYIILVSKNNGNLCILKHNNTTLSDENDLVEDEAMRIHGAQFVMRDSIFMVSCVDKWNSTRTVKVFDIKGILLSEDTVGHYDTGYVYNASSNGRYLLIENWSDEEEYYIYDRWNGVRKDTLRVNSFSKFFSFDNSSIYFLKYNERDTTIEHNILQKYNIENGDTVICATVPQGYYAIDRCATNRCILFEGEDNSPNLFVFNTETNKIISEGMVKYISIKYSPNGKHIIATRSDRTINLYDAKTFNLLDSYTKGTSYILGFSPDSEYVLLDIDNHMELWSLFPLRPIWSIENNTYAELKKKNQSALRYGHWSPYLTFSKDGKSIIFYSEKTYKDGRLHFTRIPVLSQEELKARVQELAKGRKLTEEEKNLLME